MTTTTFMCAIVLRIAFAQDALTNRKLLINCSWNWGGSKPKMLTSEDKKQREGMLWISF